MDEVKSTNGIWHSRYGGEDGYGDTYYSLGKVNFVDGKPYFDSTSFEQFLKSVEGKVIGLEIVLGLKRLEKYGEYDVKIKPLVEALQRLGVRTLNSCEGHMEERYNYLIRYPYVDFPAKDRVLFEKLLTLAWTIQVAPLGDDSVVRLRTRVEAESKDMLTVLHGEIDKLVGNLNG